MNSTALQLDTRPSQIVLPSWHTDEVLSHELNSQQWAKISPLYEFHPATQCSDSDYWENGTIVKGNIIIQIIQLSGKSITKSDAYGKLEKVINMPENSDIMKYIDLAEQNRRDMELRLKEDKRDLEKHLLDDRKESEERINRAVEKLADKFDALDDDNKKNTREQRYWLLAILVAVAGTCLTAFIGISQIVTQFMAILKQIH